MNGTCINVLVWCIDLNDVISPYIILPLLDASGTTGPSNCLGLAIDLPCSRSAASPYRDDLLDMSLEEEHQMCISRNTDRTLFRLCSCWYVFYSE